MLELQVRRTHGCSVNSEFLSRSKDCEYEDDKERAAAWADKYALPVAVKELGLALVVVSFVSDICLIASQQNELLLKVS